MRRSWRSRRRARTRDGVMCPSRADSQPWEELLLAAYSLIDLVPNPILSSELLERNVRLERSAEIIAKKMWHRGDRVTARDLFDLAAVYELDGSELDIAAPYMAKNAPAFLQQIHERRAILQAEFDAIDRLDFTRSYDECVDIARAVLLPRA